MGTGEMAIRAATAHSVVFYLKMGLSLTEAGKRAMADLNDLGGRYLGGMSFVAVDREGNHAAFSSYRDATYLYMDASMTTPETLPRTHVRITQRWEKRGTDRTSE
jgi:beta-aspartyl-peptidase (threonine type)